MQSDKSTPVLITGADTITGYNTARAIRDLDVGIWGLTSDITSKECTSVYWDRLIKIEPTAQNVLDVLILTGQEYQSGHDAKNKIILLISQDYVVRAVSSQRNELSKYYHFVLPEHDIVERLLDKTKFHEWAYEAGHSVPGTFMVKDEAELESVLSTIKYPAILKPSERSDLWDYKNSSIKGIRLNCETDLKPYRQDLFKWAPDYIIQEWVPGDDEQVYFCLFYFDSNGNELSFQLL